MKTFKCVLTALVLSFSLSTAAIAGDIQTVGITGPPPPPPPAAASEAGDMQGQVTLLIELLEIELLQLAVFF
jgi:hypothetical protein